MLGSEVLQKMKLVAGVHATRRLFVERSQDRTDRATLYEVLDFFRHFAKSLHVGEDLTTLTDEEGFLADFHFAFLADTRSAFGESHFSFGGLGREVFVRRIQEPLLVLLAECFLERATFATLKVRELAGELCQIAFANPLPHRDAGDERIIGAAAEENNNVTFFFVYLSVENPKVSIRNNHCFLAVHQLDGGVGDFDKTHFERCHRHQLLHGVVVERRSVNYRNVAVRVDAGDIVFFEERFGRAVRREYRQTTDVRDGNRRKVHVLGKEHLPEHINQFTHQSEDRVGSARFGLDHRLFVLHELDSTIDVVVVLVTIAFCLVAVSGLLVLSHLFQFPCPAEGVCSMIKWRRLTLSLCHKNFAKTTI